jgi:flagellar protein FlbT
MSLKICLKPQERMIIGGAVLQNTGGRCDLLVENQVPILREKDIMGEKNADSPCKRIYFTIQLMYVDENNLVEHHNTYWMLIRDLVNAAPSTLTLVDQISDHLLNGRYYQALKLTKTLIEYEQEVIKNVCNSNGSLPDGAKNKLIGTGIGGIRINEGGAGAAARPE